MSIYMTVYKCICLPEYMYVCMYVCMYLCIVCVYTCVHAYICICMYVYMYACLQLCIHVCMYAIFKLNFERYEMGNWVTGQNGSGQNGTDKMVWIKWYADKMV